MKHQLVPKSLHNDSVMPNMDACKIEQPLNTGCCWEEAWSWHFLSERTIPGKRCVQIRYQHTQQLDKWWPIAIRGTSVGHPRGLHFLPEFQVSRCCDLELFLTWHLWESNSKYKMGVNAKLSFGELYSWFPTKKEKKLKMKFEKMIHVCLAVLTSWCSF